MNCFHQVLSPALDGGGGEPSDPESGDAIVFDLSRRRGGSGWRGRLASEISLVQTSRGCGVVVVVVKERKGWG